MGFHQSIEFEGTKRPTDTLDKGVLGPISSYAPAHMDGEGKQMAFEEA
jgi:hypothetical protein